MPITYEWIKLYGRILDSSIMEYSIPARLFFYQALVASDNAGRLFGTTAALARRFNMPEESVIQSIEDLAAPDPESKNKEYEGSRLVQVGPQEYLVVSKRDYNPDPTNAERQERFRNARNASNAGVTESNARYGNNDRGEERREEKTERYTPQFEGVFWGIFPRKVGKAAALRAWARLSETDRLLASDGVGCLAEAWRVRPSAELRYCPYPATWLNDRRWEDKPEPTPAIEAGRKISYSLAEMDLPDKVG